MVLSRRQETELLQTRYLWKPDRHVNKCSLVLRIYVLMEH